MCSYDSALYFMNELPENELKLAITVPLFDVYIQSFLDDLVLLVFQQIAIACHSVLLQRTIHISPLQECYI